jgi:hypothetical protein
MHTRRLSAKAPRWHGSNHIADVIVVARVCRGDGAALPAGSLVKVVIVPLVGAMEMAPAARRQPHQGRCRPRHGG